DPRGVLLVRYGVGGSVLVRRDRGGRGGFAPVRFDMIGFTLVRRALGHLGRLTRGRRGLCGLTGTSALGCLIRLAGRGGRTASAAPEVPDDVPHDQHHQRGEQVVRVQR